MSSILRVRKPNGEVIEVLAIKGENGKDGRDGITPKKGVDYFDGKDYEITEADYQAIANIVAGMIPELDSQVVLADGSINRETLFSNEMAYKYLSLPMFKVSVTADLTDAHYNSYTTAGIYQLGSQIGTKQVLIVLKPDSDAHLMQIRLSYNKLEYRGIHCSEGGVYADDDWEEWIDLTATKTGSDGYSPTAQVTQTANGATVTITDKNGTTTANIVNGKDGTDGADGKDGAAGEKGADGYTPVKGVDYFTEADKQEIAELVLANMPSAEGVGY